VHGRFDAHDGAVARQHPRHQPTRRGTPGRVITATSSARPPRLRQRPRPAVHGRPARDDLAHLFGERRVGRVLLDRAGVVDRIARGWVSSRSTMLLLMGRVMAIRVMASRRPGALEFSVSVVRSVRECPRNSESVKFSKRPCPGGADERTGARKKSLPGGS
jgi:hypothetical protein